MGNQAKETLSGCRNLILTTTAIVTLAMPVFLTLVGAPHLGAQVPASARTAPSGQSIAELAPQVKSAADGVFDLFKQKSVVALGDAHNLAQEEAFYSSLVRDPRFAEQVGNVVVEFGGLAAQDIIDRYVNGEDVPFIEFRHVWTDVVGWLPGPFSLGYINFFANVRAANLKLPIDHRIKVWLGDPKIDWSKINSFQGLQPILERRDDNVFGIINDEILKKQKKTLLIIGGGHLLGPELNPSSLPDVGTQISDAYPNALAVVHPFIGYIEPECTAKVVDIAKNWPVPAIAGPIEGTWLKSELQLPGCNYIPLEEVDRMMAAVAPAVAARQIAFQVGMRSGVTASAILYLGPPDALTFSPLEPSIYFDSDYFKEMNRRAQCCVPNSYSLDWDQIQQRDSVVPRKYQAR
jgi:hypothetical protein